MTARRYTFPKALRIIRSQDFDAIYADNVRHASGPITVVGRPNGLDHPRLGLSVPRRVGTAVRRNRIKRLLRESFRLMRHDLPKGYDLIVSVRPHTPLMLADYQRLLSKAARRVHEGWSGRTPPDSNSHRGDAEGSEFAE